jgi:TolB-like protein
LAGLILAGCGGEPENRLGYYTAPRRDLVRVRRVAMLPLANESDHPGTQTGLSEELFRAVQACQLFHVRPLDPEAPEAAALPPVGTEPLTLGDLQRLRRALGSDAVLAGTVTRWQPYPRMQTGLYLRLVDLRSGEVLWAVDHVWDATDEHTQRRIRRFFAHRMGTGTDPFGWELGTVSPRAFQKFVAHEVVETLPGRRPQADGGLAREFRKNLGM